MYVCMYVCMYIYVCVCLVCMCVAIRHHRHYYDDLSLSPPRRISAPERAHLTDVIRRCQTTMAHDDDGRPEDDTYDTYDTLVASQRSSARAPPSIVTSLTPSKLTTPPSCLMTISDGTERSRSIPSDVWWRRGNGNGMVM